ncbi:carbohydrate ABC transporter permease [Paenibacillus sp. WQ 127069]|uniref:Carbohydrate ABC transporter permease n=1 Tax=Paenibacillus baimaensis TaxID=2982185 RepID=A0ABT2UGD3_9BACL|nr:carbohydrate ABC transporter permease [Paenibacillus sp. WQ 127069]MCU6792729.1 carbohydrate ABC transporter permease [Paenibacillus sp. WQ 127069]
MYLYRSWGSRLFDSINYILLFVLAFVTVIPFLLNVTGSFASPEEALKKSFILIPERFSLEAYHYVFSSNVIPHSLLITVFITVVGTAINIIFTSLMAFPLANKRLRVRQPVLLLVIFSMLFSGGMIPTYLVIKSLGLLNTYGSLMIPGAISAFYLIILKNFFMQLPDELEDSARIDGCNDLHVLFRIVIPLSMPAIATLTLFYAVGHWNAFFNALLYINDSAKFPIQVWLRQIVILSQTGIGDSANSFEGAIPPGKTIQMSVTVVSTVPILIVYPFLQRHFAKGVLLGSVKE